MQKLKNNEPRPKFTGSYKKKTKKKRVYCGPKTEKVSKKQEPRSNFESGGADK